MNLVIRRRYVVGCAAAVLLLGFGGWWVGTVVWKSTGQFVPQEDDPRVLYERGAEVMAGQVARALPKAIEAVEQGQYRPFAGPVRVYVCASMESFRSYGLRAGYAAGFVLNQRLFLSPKPENTAERIPRILTHELSHLHLEQQMGSYRAAAGLPDWFREGLAVYVSRGGGAENVSEDEARAANAGGRHFLPETTGGLLFPTGATAYGLEHHMFYRQSALFIDYLKRRDETQFKAFLVAVEDGRSLKDAFDEAYRTSMESVWEGFVRECVVGRPAHNGEMRKAE